MDDVVKYLTDEQLKDYLTVQIYNAMITRASVTSFTTAYVSEAIENAVSVYNKMKALQNHG